MKKMFFVLLLFGIGCSVKLNPSKSIEATDRLSDIQKGVNTLFSDGSYYIDVQQLYITIETEIYDLIEYNKTRPLSGTIVEQTKLLQKMTVKIESEHKAYGHISSTVAGLYKDELSTIIDQITKSEKSLK